MMQRLQNIFESHFAPLIENINFTTEFQQMKNPTSISKASKTQIFSQNLSLSHPYRILNPTLKSDLMETSPKKRINEVSLIRIYKSKKRMLEKEMSLTTQTSTPSRSKKTLCTKCCKSVLSYQFEFHYEHCGQDEAYVIYRPQEEVEDEYKMDIDLVDIPLNGSSLQLKGLTSEEVGAQKLPIVPYLPDQESGSCAENCCFCRKDLEQRKEVVVLPCGHRLHYSCLQKWNIIVDPCRICHPSFPIKMTTVY